MAIGYGDGLSALMQVVTDDEGNTARIAVTVFGPRREVDQDGGTKMLVREVE